MVQTPATRSGIELSPALATSDTHGQATGLSRDVRAVELVERAARGDADAFDLLMSDSLERLVRAGAPDPSRHRPCRGCRAGGPDPLLARTAAVARSESVRRLAPAIARQRSDGPAQALSPLRAVVSLIPDPQAGRDISIDVAQADELRDAFERLRLEHRVVLVLHHYLELSAVEIADRLEIPPGTVKSRLHYAAVAMRAAVDAGMRGPASVAEERQR